MADLELKKVQEFRMVLDGVAWTVTGRIVAQVGDPARKMVYTFIKGETGGNYLQRRGVCSCDQCQGQEEKEDWLRFDSWEELRERAGEIWLLELVARGMCERTANLH